MSFPNSLIRITYSKRKETKFKRINLHAKLEQKYVMNSTISQEHLTLINASSLGYNLAKLSSNEAALNT
jgi:hypothetical protein